MTSPSPTGTSPVNRQWVVVDAEGRVLGRLASQVAQILRGKNKPEFLANLDCGDGVIVINAAKIRVTGAKLRQKFYYRHSGYPGGLRRTRLDELLSKHPERVIQKAVRGMLPKNSLGRSCYRRLRVYAGEEHRHAAQQPVTTE